MSAASITAPHENSRKVKFLRNQSFLESAQSGLADYYALANKSIGPYYEGKGTTAIGTGMDYMEVELLLPYIIDYRPEEREYKQKVKEFYCDVTTKVPFDGVELEIGLRTDNNKPVSKDNMPINIMDYLRYRHALGHPEVAGSREDAAGNVLVNFYLYDPSAIRKAGVNLRELKEQSMEQYLLLTKSKDLEHVDNIIAVLGTDPRKFKNRDEKMDHLESIINSGKQEAIQKFLDVTTDKGLALKGFLGKLVFTGVVKLVGSRYIIAETDQILGDGEEEALLELGDDDKNKSLLVVLKSQLQEKMKAKIAAGKKAATN